MTFELGSFFEDIFKPSRGEVVTVVIDLPHDDVVDNPAWQERRKMAKDWRTQLADLAYRWGIEVNPLATFPATGGNNADLPDSCCIGDRETTMKDMLDSSTIVLAMTEFSATAPMYAFSKRSSRLRVASMPGVAPSMEESALSADYADISAKCKVLVERFNRALSADVEFSTGHRCHFDLTRGGEPDDGILHPERAGGEMSLSNLPAGEVYTVPNEAPDSKTHGELPYMLDGHLAVFEVEHNKITGLGGEGSAVDDLRQKFLADPAWCNIAEFAVGLNDKARVTGIVLEDEKAGFHWAYGRSDHLGGTIGVKDFTSPKNVVHQDVVYAKESPIACQKLVMNYADGTCEMLIEGGTLATAVMNVSRSSMTTP